MQARFQQNLSKGIIGQPDSTELWKEIVSYIPDSVLLKDDVKVLNVAAGHGTEAAVLVERMRTLGKTDQEIDKSLYLIDKYRVFTNPLKRSFSNVYTGDFLEVDLGKKFDVVIGNPPFQSRKSNSDNNLYVSFINKAYDFVNKGGSILMITPSTWLGKNKKSKKTDYSVLANNQIKELVLFEEQNYFNVGSSISYFYLIKSEPLNPTNLKVRKHDSVIAHLNHELVFDGHPYPKFVDDKSISIHKKITQANLKKWGFTCEFHSQNLKSKNLINDKQDDNYKFKTYYSPKLHRYANKKMSIYDEIKCMISISSTLKNCWVDKECNLTEDVRYLTFPDIDSAQQAKNNIMNLQYCQYIDRMYRPGRNNVCFNLLPDISYDKPLNDQDIYDYFQLTESEIAYIEETVKRNYRT